MAFRERLAKSSVILTRRSSLQKIYDLPEDEINLLLDRFNSRISGISSINVGNSLADEFEKIILASRRRRSRAKPASSIVTSHADIQPTDANLFVETGGKCPICGAKIVAFGERGGRPCEVVDITPLNVRKDYRTAVEYGVTNADMPEPGTAEGRIVLCCDCAVMYNTGPTAEEFKKVYEAKRMLLARSKLASEIPGFALDAEISKVLTGLAELRDFAELENLSMTALRIDQKINMDNHLLLEKIRDYVVRYYKFIENRCGQLETQGDLDFTLLASQVKTCYLRLRGLGQEETFQLIAEWMQEKTGTTSMIACEILTAFFVQNCEVFDDTAAR